MNTQTIFMCVVALLIGMLVANMLQNVCGCKKVEGFASGSADEDTGMPLTIDEKNIINKFIKLENQNVENSNPCGGFYGDIRNPAIPAGEIINELKTSVCDNDRSYDTLTEYLKTIDRGNCIAVDEGDFDSTDCERLQ